MLFGCNKPIIFRVSYNTVITCCYFSQKLLSEACLLLFIIKKSIQYVLSCTLFDDKGVRHIISYGFSRMQKLHLRCMMETTRFYALLAVRGAC